MPNKARKSAGSTKLANPQDACDSALLIIDMVATWDFPDGDVLLQRAARVAPNLARLRQRCVKAGVPVIFANDNHGHWRSDFRTVIAASLEAGGAAAQVTTRLAPTEADYAVLKPKHSAFLATPLELLPEHLDVKRLIVAGVSSDQCVLNTVADARMRDFEVEVARDCIASLSLSREKSALCHFQEVMRIPLKNGSNVRLIRRGNASQG